MHRSPSRADRGRALAGRALLGQPRDRDLRGGRGRGRQSDDTNYSLGSVLNHVCLHQTVIGQEAIAQLELAGEYPDVVIGCVGGGSNFAGVAFPFIRANLREGKRDPVHRRRAGRLPDPDQGRLPLRLRRHRRADAADADVHARPRLRPAAGARRRPALPRRLADRQRPGQGGRGRGARGAPDRGLRGGDHGSPAARGSSRRPSPRTRCGPRSTRPRRRSRRARSG